MDGNDGYFEKEEKGGINNFCCRWDRHVRQSTWILDSRKSMNVKVCRNFHGDKDKRSWLGFNGT